MKALEAEPHPSSRTSGSGRFAAPMTRERFARVLAWTPADEEADKLGHHTNATKRRPATWPQIMLAQRIAWRDGPAEAYLRLIGERRDAA